MVGWGYISAIAVQAFEFVRQK